MFRQLITTLITALVLSAVSFAANYAVGACDIELTSFATISLAVSSVPPGSTINVCPGNYPEQVLITQPLTLTGFKNKNTPTVTVPSGGLTQSVTDEFAGNVYYQILVQGTTGPVNISNLVVNGTGGSGAPSFAVAGVFYQDASGTVDGVSAQNQVNGNGYGYGILATTNLATAQTVTVEKSDARGFDGFGIEAATGNNLTVHITANVVNNTGNTGINLGGVGLTGTAQSNTVDNSGSGYSIGLNGTALTVTGNTVFGGILAAAGSNTIESNKIDGNNNYGITLQGSASSSLVKSNTIAYSASAVWGCNGASGFTVTNNTIIDAVIGVQMPSGNTITPNSFFATTTTVSGC
jgi:hypothetical protein